MAPRIENMFEISGLVRVGMAFLQSQQFRKADHRIERRAQLMAQASEELGLGATPDLRDFLVA
ncbi:MAG TPA: hypothetical protein VF319_13760, partial [Caldimonas sp.]